MDRNDVQTWAARLVRGEVSITEFVGQLLPARTADLGVANIDLDRRRRCGFPEVVFGQGKTPEALQRIFETLEADGTEVLATRISPEQAQRLSERFPGGVYNSLGRTYRLPVTGTALRQGGDAAGADGLIAIVTAGTSDLPVAEEARETALWMGVAVRMIHDVGVAGPHRLVEHLEKFDGADAVVVIAGMEGALPSVVGGYVGCPVIAVPTSVGYGASFGGVAALLGMLNSCAANVTVVNIDAGFKGAYIAGMIARNAALVESQAMNGSAVQRDDSPLPRLAPRAPDSNKGTYGRATLVGGSRGMTGAIALAGMSCLRGGAGLVHLVVPETCQDVVAGLHPCYMTIGVASDDAGRISYNAVNTIYRETSKATAVAFGPGLGQSDDLTKLVQALYHVLPQPAVFDADALNALARGGKMDAAKGPRILTPHPGEFARLLGWETDKIAAAREKLAVEFASVNHVVLVLKGHHTIVTDGQRISINTTGNPGMATGGTGDVLTGLITALLCQSLAPYDAARLGVYLHGLAGDLAAAELGEVSLVASDLIDYLPAAFQKHAAHSD